MSVILLNLLYIAHCQEWH